MRKIGAALGCIAVLSACGAAPPPPPPPVPDPDGGTDAGCRGGEVMQLFEVHDTDNNGPTLSGVAACILQADGGWDECETTGVTGQRRFCRPPGSQVAVSYSLAGFMPLVLAYTSPSDGGVTADFVGLRTETLGCGGWKTIGLTCPPVDQAFLWTRIHADGPELPAPPGIAGITVTAPGSATWYNRETSSQLELLGATTGNGNSYLVFDGGTTRVIELDVTGAGLTCSHLMYGWAGDSPNRVKTVIRPGFRTFASATCR